MPLEFFSTLAAGIGLALFEGAKTAKRNLTAAEIQKRDEDLMAAYKKAQAEWPYPWKMYSWGTDSGNYVGKDRHAINSLVTDMKHGGFDRIHNLHKELTGEEPPIVDMMLKYSGGSHSGRAFFDCCVYGISQKYRWDWGQYKYENRCLFCYEFGEACKQPHNFYNTYYPDFASVPKPPYWSVKTLENYFRMTQSAKPSKKETVILPVDFSRFEKLKGLKPKELEDLCHKEGLSTPLPVRDFSSHCVTAQDDDIIKHCSICYLLHKEKMPWKGALCEPCTFCPERLRRCERHVNRQLLKKTYGSDDVGYLFRALRRPNNSKKG